AAGAGCPREGKMQLRTGHADIEQAALLVQGARHTERLLARELLLLDARDEDRLELEALRTMECEQVDASMRTMLEASLQPLLPVGHCLRAVVELFCEAAEPP